LGVAERWLVDVAGQPSHPFPSGISQENYWEGTRPDTQHAYICQIWSGGFVPRYQALLTRTQAFRQRLIPKSIYILLGILAALTAGGVIAPLFFLSADSGPSKALLLVVFIPLALGFVGYLFFEVFRIRQAADLSRAIF
jgi:hypothetical protein